MPTIIVYYSLEGNTEYAANRIAEKLGADTLRLEPVKAYPSGGFKKFFWGGKSAVMGETPKLEPYAFDPAAWDRIVFGFPVWAGNMAPPLRTFLRDNDLSGKRFAAFACQSGNGAEKAFARLKAALGVDTLEAELVLIDPKARPSEENERKLAEFCARLAPADAPRTAELRFDSFDGGGPEYSVELADPAIARCAGARNYGSADHAEVDGAAYTVTFTFSGAQPGRTTATVKARSPIAENFDAVYAVIVDASLKVTLEQIEYNER